MARAAEATLGILCVLRPVLPHVGALELPATRTVNAERRLKSAAQRLHDFRLSYAPLPKARRHQKKASKAFGLRIIV